MDDCYVADVIDCLVCSIQSMSRLHDMQLRNVYADLVEMHIRVAVVEHALETRRRRHRVRRRRAQN